ncbi:MAG: metallophosphoesterase [Clostridia bacterium]|jgi:hypothetical protein
MQSYIYSAEEDKKILQLKSQGYTYEEIAKFMGKTKEAVRKRYYRIMNTVNANKTKGKYKNKEEHVLDILQKNINVSLEELKDLIEVTNMADVLITLYSLMSDGYDITIHSDWVFYESANTINKYNFIRGDEGKLKVALTGDWHLGSKKQQITRLQEFLQFAYDNGVRNVVHSGDVNDGTRVFKGHGEEVFLHTVDEQVDYAKEVIPRYDGLHYYVISGNHDHDNTGVNGVRTLANYRDDITYLGKYGAYLTLNGVTIYLHHGLGGRAYAMSYKLQKFVEQLPVEYTPDIIAQAHYHYLFYAPIRGVESFEVGSFQGLTAFAARMGRVYSEIAGWVVEIEKTKDSVTMIPLDRRYKEINHDYPYMHHGGKVFNF